MPCNVYITRFTHVLANIFGSSFCKPLFFFTSHTWVKFIVPCWTLNCILLLRSASFCYCKTRCKNFEPVVTTLLKRRLFTIMQHTRDVTRANANYECRQYLSSRVSMRKSIMITFSARAVAQLILNATNIKIRYIERKRERERQT